METYLFEIGDYSGTCISMQGCKGIIKAKNGREALKKYLKDAGINIKVKRSGSNDVQFCVTPVVKHNEKIYIDGTKRKTWYQIVNN